MNLRGKKVLVLGLGETGLAMAKWLTRQGAVVRVADSRAAPPQLEALKTALPKVAVRTGAFVREDFTGIELIAVSPGVPLSESLLQEAQARGAEIVGDIELFARALQQFKIASAKPDSKFKTQKVIAITGSNGKTTVTAMVGAMLRRAGMDAQVAGNISPSVLDALMAREESGTLPQAWVLELSSFQLETTRSLHPDAAAVLNVSEDHLDRYAGMDAYAAAKARIFAGDGLRVLNRDDAAVMAMNADTAVSVSIGLDAPRQRTEDRGQRTDSAASVTFGLDAPDNDGDFGLIVDNGITWLTQGKTRLLKTGELQVAGLHNAANALAALALCRALGVAMVPLLQALREFRGLPHRVEKIATINGATYFDDSKGTNVGATLAAIRGLSEHGQRKLVLILGGDGKGQDFAPLKSAVAQHARAVVLIGRDAKLIAAAIAGDAQTGAPLYFADSMEAAVEKCAELSQRGDAVLMSPACASLDMFKNYAHRAEVFVAAVDRLVKSEK